MIVENQARASLPLTDPVIVPVVMPCAAARWEDENAHGHYAQSQELNLYLHRASGVLTKVCTKNASDMTHIYQ